MENTLLEKENNITTNIKECCGCAACANICPTEAIKIIQDKEGFYKPEIDKTKCISCGKCLKVCPVDHNKYNNFETPKVYAAMANDEIRQVSSSGGAFSLIAETILEAHGVVCGAAFNKNWKIEHILIDKKEELEKLRGSKYVQSFISETLYKEIKSHLDNGRKVLFSGVPCQVAGLLNYLGKNYENLYTIDLICAYIPPYKVFEKYIEENYGKNNIQSIKFRCKENINWGNSIQQLKITEANNVIFDKKYMTPYLDRLFKGTQCENCKFKKFPRPADITIGDFWKIDKFTPDMNDNKGTSAIVLNTEKGEEIFEKIKNQFKKTKQMPLESAGWQIDVKHKIYKTPACKNFFKNIDTKSYNKNIIEASKESTVGIINWWFVNNRGAILTNYALNEMVKELGYNALTINYITPFERENFKNSFAEDFANKYIKRTSWINTKEELKTLNNTIGTFICGSDQVFRYYPCKLHDMIFYMNWVDANKNKLISYAASFATNIFEANPEQTNFVKHKLSRFDKHSIREFDGVDLMKNTFDIDNATQVLDPVFCIDKQKYLNMAQNAENKPTEDFIAYYIMWPTKENKKIINHVQKKLGIKKAINLNPPMSIENWLWYIANAKFIVTDSFHGTSFALIFNKEFAAIPRETEYPSRFKSIEKISGLSSRFFYNNNDIYTSDKILKPLDFTESNKNFALRKKDSIKWLQTVLESPKTKKLTPEQEMYDAIINDYTTLINSKIHYLENKEKIKSKKFITNIFSIQNEYTPNKKHKVITIAGIKLKLRIKR